METQRFSITIPEEAWVVEDDSRIIARLDINGTPHHLEGWLCYKQDDAGSVDLAGDGDGLWTIWTISEGEWIEEPETASEIWNAFAIDGGPETITVNGMNYAVFMSPYS